MKTNMEEILGMAIRSTGSLGVEGLKDRNGRAVMFFEVSPEEQAGQRFRKLTNAINPPYATSGGAVEYGCAVTVNSP